MILGFLLAAIYLPGISGAAVASKWAVLAVGLPLLIKLPTRFTVAHAFGLAFLGWLALSLLWTPNRYDGVSELIRFVILAQAFLLGEQADIGRIFRGMAYGLCVSSAVLLLQLFWPDIVQHQTTHAGLYINSGTLAEISSAILVGVIVSGMRGGVEGHAGQSLFKLDAPRHSMRGIGSPRIAGVESSPRIWFLMAGLLPCVVLPQSRGAWLGLVAAVMLWLWSKSRVSALVLVALTVICITYSFSIGFHISSVEQRLGMWGDTVRGLTWLGHGVGSYWTDYAYLNTTMDTFIERPEHAHNDWLEIVFELGAVGVVWIAAVGWLLIRSNSPARFVLACLAAESLVGFPLYNPATGFVAALCLGHLVRNSADLRDVFASCRVLLRGGMDGSFSLRSRCHRGIAQGC